MKSVIFIAILSVVLIALAYLGNQMMRPIPFLTTAERQSYDLYKEIAYKLAMERGLKLDKKRFPSRADLVADLLSTNFYTMDQISFLGEDECLNGNKLYEYGIVFWRRGDKAVFFIDENWHIHMEGKREFDYRLEYYSK